MQSLETLKTQFSEANYIADPDLITAVLLMKQLDRPLLIEGEAGVGKTEIAKALAQIENCKLIRLQCYEGLETSGAVYEWNYSQQLLSIKLQESISESRNLDIFNTNFLLERPLLQSIRQRESPVLLIDEIDRADEAFEAYLLELLSDFQVSIPELGTLEAISIPRVILTSNGTRELSDALRRRCLYHYLDFPDRERELQIIKLRVPGLDQRLAAQIVDFMQILRQQNLAKNPGIAETLDWCAALKGLGVNDLLDNIKVAHGTRGCFLKTQDDLETVSNENMAKILKQIA